jgi:hypothetical protein
LILKSTLLKHRGRKKTKNGANQQKKQTRKATTKKQTIIVRK